MPAGSYPGDSTTTKQHSVAAESEGYRWLLNEFPRTEYEGLLGRQTLFYDYVFFFFFCR